MIRIHGTVLAKEYAAAEALRDMIVECWPDAETSSQQSIEIIASAKCFGQIKSDVDILVLGNVNYWLDIDNNNRLEKFNIQNLCMAVEVKGSPEDKVRFVGNQVEVSYWNSYKKQSEWHSASEQSHDQGVSVGNYLRNNGCNGLFVNNVIWLNHYPSSLLPRTDHNIMGRDSSWEAFLTCICHSSKAWRQKDGTYVIGGSKNDAAIQKATQIFTKSITSTPLDRKRMERISRSFVKIKPQQYVERFGEIIIVFRGRGGTGKTLRLIQLAHYFYDNDSARILFLTYNKALVADIRRLFSLMNISTDIADRAISVMTVHRYVRKLLVAFEIMPQDAEDFYDNYEQYKAKLLSLIGGEERASLEALLGRSSNVLSWDFTLVDEAQDWPEDERDILFATQSYKQVILADGVDQLVRSHAPTDWLKPLETERVKDLSSGSLQQITVRRKKDDFSKVVTLRKSLRLKSRLCTFVNDFSEALGTHWNLEPLHDVYGGKLIVLEGPWTAYALDRSFHENLMQDLRLEGNFNIDALFCVHPSLCAEINGKKRSMPGMVFERWGYQCWDGTAEDIRDSCPTEPEQIRIVQYDSCRGLEGWLVVNFEIDEFFDYKMNTYKPTPTETEDMFFNHREAALRHAEQWLLIPMSRAIDTLVLQVKNKDHVVTKALADVASHYTDLVEWRKL